MVTQAKRKGNKMEYLIAVDLEGIHGIVGEPYKTLTESFDYKEAAYAAALEINAAVRALFDNGATAVYVWDNHGGGNNIDFSYVDKRAVRVDTAGDKRRYDFTLPHNFAGTIFIGYHSKEGTPKGILAHSYSSTAIQYIKLNGEAIGELGTDSFICEMHGIAPIFAASDDCGICEIKEYYPDIETVTTKYGRGRNSADFKDRELVLAEIYNGVAAAMKKPHPTITKEFPSPSTLEIRYTRAEYAEQVHKKALSLSVKTEWGEDTHTLRFVITKPNEIPLLV